MFSLRTIEDHDDHLLYFCEPSKPSPVIFPKERVCVWKKKKFPPPGNENWQHPQRKLPHRNNNNINDNEFLSFTLGTRTFMATLPSPLS